MASTTGYQQDADGAKFIPATQRADGTWRKPRRVRDGYVPQEEVPLYESRGKQFAAKQNTGIPVGLTAEIVAAASKPKKQGHTKPNVISPIPGLIINVDVSKKKKKKKPSVEEVTSKLSAATLTSESANTTPSDPLKRLRNLKKKLREIELLQEKIKSGEVKTPGKDQIDKIMKKNDVISEIKTLELTVQDND